jgi:hypothetical protein
VTTPEVGDGYVLEGEPVGVWTQASTPPFSARAEAFSDVLSDGRVLVWGGVDDIEGGHSEADPGGLSDGGIYDPGSDTWEAIPSPPGSGSFGGALLEDDRLVAFGADGEVRRTVVYEVASGTWTEAPERTPSGDLEAVPAWNGETVAIVATGRFIAPAGDDRPPALTTIRWTLGDDQWVEGAPFPLTPRSLTGADDDGDLLAIWGGTATTYAEDALPPLTNDEGLLGDGAIYDVAADAWTVLPQAPVEGATDPAVMWADGRLIVGGGGDGRGDHEWTASHRRTPAAFDPASNSWATLPQAPRISFDGEVPANSPAGPSVQYDFGPPRFLVAADDGGSRGIHVWFVHDGAWEQAPYVSVHGDPDGLVVSSSDWDSGNPEEYPFELAVRDGPGHWTPALAAPFTNRGGASINAADGRIVVVGGYEHSSMTPAAAAWVFDPDG